MSREGWRHIPPYDFRYRFAVTREYEGLPLIQFYARRFKYLPESYWRGLVTGGFVTVNERPATPETLLNHGDVIHTVRGNVQEPPVNDGYKIIHDADGLFVIDKPAPLAVHPSGRYFRNSLTSILKEDFPDRRFHTLHRLDLWTTGVLSLATDADVAHHLHREIEKKRVRKTYAVLAVGNFGNAAFSVDAPIGRAGGAKRGFSGDLTSVKECVTRFKPLLKKNAVVAGETAEVNLLAAEPVTGRTNQIRVHVQAAGGHVLNDPLYSPKPPAEDEMTFLGLHCRNMAFMLAGDRPFSATAPWPRGFLDFFDARELDACFAEEPLFSPAAFSA